MNSAKTPHQENELWVEAVLEARMHAHGQPQKTNL